IVLITMRRGSTQRFYIQRSSNADKREQNDFGAQRSKRCRQFFSLMSSAGDDNALALKSTHLLARGQYLPCTSGQKILCDSSAQFFRAVTRSSRLSSQTTRAIRRKHHGYNLKSAFDRFRKHCDG